MRILYDGFVYYMQKAGGINRYFTNLISMLPDTVVPILTVRDFDPLNFPTHPNLKIFNRRFEFRPGRIAYRLERACFRLHSQTERYDVVHPTYYSCLTQSPVGGYKAPIVLTVYDMIYERFPELLDPDGSMAKSKREAIMAADILLCISEHTKQDLMKYCPVPEEKVRVIHLATDIDPARSYGPERVPIQPYYLYVGSRASYKNFDRLLLAFAKAASVKSDLMLGVVGSPFTPTEAQSIDNLGIAGNVEHYGHVNDAHLAKLYRCSLGLVYPSLYEGFGIPPLEAMACGTVVIAADASCIPEILEDAGILFNPLSVDDLADILLTLSVRPALREEYIERGHSRVKLFSWQTTMERTLAVYNALSKR